MAPRFRYQAKEGPHKVVEGLLDAADSAKAISELIRNGLAPIEVVEESKSSPQEKLQAAGVHLKGATANIKKQEVVLFTRQMADLLEASVPIFKALKIVAEKTKGKDLRNTIDAIADGINNGSSFSNELNRFDRNFSAYYVNMVRSGEMAGKLEVIMGRLADFLEKEQEVKGKVQASLAYPLLILAIGFVVIFVMLAFVAPRFVVMFEDSGQQLPLPTIILMGVSGFFINYWWLIVGIFIGLVASVRVWWRSENGRRWVDSHLIRVWLIGAFIQVVETGRFARTLGTLIESGVTIVSALNIAKDTVTNCKLKDELSVVVLDVTKGVPLSRALKQVSFFPDTVSSMIVIGEETGRFEKGLYKMADLFEREAEHMMKTSLSLLGPIVLTGVIIFVGFIVIAIMLPVMQIIQLIN